MRGTSSCPTNRKLYPSSKSLPSTYQYSGDLPGINIQVIYLGSIFRRFTWDQYSDDLPGSLISPSFLIHLVTLKLSYCYKWFKFIKQSFLFTFSIEFHLFKHICLVIFSHFQKILGAIVVMNILQLDLQLPMYSVAITSNVVSLNPTQATYTRYNII